MKKGLIILVLASCIVFGLAGCRNKAVASAEEVKKTVPNEIIEADVLEEKESKMNKTEKIEETEQPEEPERTEELIEANETEKLSDRSEVVSTPVSEEIAAVEAAYQEILSRDSDNYTQAEMNAECYEEYELWNNELNALWEQVKATVKDDAYTDILGEQRAWLERKRYHVRACGAEAFGGSMQPMLESSAASDMTRVRCYQLAKLLADARGEQLSMDEADAMIDYVDPTYDEVMWGLRGTYNLVSYDDSTGEIVISHETGEWEPIITYNGVRQQVELWGYTTNRIIWKSSEEEYFELGLSWESELEFTHRDDLQKYVDADL